MTDLVKRLRDTASNGVSVWGDLQMEAAKEIEILTAEREAYASAMERMQAELARLKAQEPVAWMTEDGRTCTAETKATSMATPSKAAFAIPLYTSSGAATKTLSDFVHSSDSEREKIGNVVAAKADEAMDKLVKLSEELGLYDGAAQTSKTIDVQWHHDLAKRENT